MAIDFVVQDAAGVAQGDALSSPIDFVGLELDSKDFPMLAGLAPWGRTIFNRKQAGWLLDELVRVAPSDPLMPNHDYERLTSMCQQVARSWHLYLVALGD